MQIELNRAEIITRLGIFMIIRGYIIRDLFVAFIQNNLCSVSFLCFPDCTIRNAIGMAVFASCKNQNSSYRGKFH